MERSLSDTGSTLSLGSDKAPGQVRNKDLNVPLENERFKTSESPGHQLPPIHRLYLDRKRRDAASDDQRQDTVDEPAVLWVATIFDAYHLSIDPTITPTIVYNDDRPISLASDTKSNGPLAPGTQSPGTGKLDQDTNLPSWRGCIFEVIDVAKAFFTASGFIGSVPIPYHKHERTRTTSQPESHRLSQSRTGISIKSPFLYVKLADIVGYYPEFYRQSPGDLLNLSCTTSKEIGTDFSIYKPYGALMHNFSKIAGLACTVAYKDSEEAMQPERPVKPGTVRLLG
ncbi:MAG: hypothetical protein LQ343_007374 [Gyalolechia ehrenbergii]|nr:MAG: hypothetical protein LQ343_007374 [Gyalolechia ehrenbergii]